MPPAMSSLESPSKLKPVARLPSWDRVSQRSFERTSSFNSSVMGDSIPGSDAMDPADVEDDPDLEDEEGVLQGFSYKFEQARLTRARDHDAGESAEAGERIGNFPPGHGEFPPGGPEKGGDDEAGEEGLDGYSFQFEQARLAKLGKALSPKARDVSLPRFEFDDHGGGSSRVSEHGGLSRATEQGFPDRRVPSSRTEEGPSAEVDPTDMRRTQSEEVPSSNTATPQFGEWSRPAPKGGQGNRYSGPFSELQRKSRMRHRPLAMRSRRDREAAAAGAAGVGDRDTAAGRLAHLPPLEEASMAEASADLESPSSLASPSGVGLPAGLSPGDDTSLASSTGGESTATSLGTQDAGCGAEGTVPADHAGGVADEDAGSVGDAESELHRHQKGSGHCSGSGNASCEEPVRAVPVDVEKLASKGEDLSPAALHSLPEAEEMLVAGKDGEGNMIAEAEAEEGDMLVETEDEEAAQFVGSFEGWSRAPRHNSSSSGRATPGSPAKAAAAGSSSPGSAQASDTIFDRSFSSCQAMESLGLAPPQSPSQVVLAGRVHQSLGPAPQSPSQGMGADRVHQSLGPAPRSPSQGMGADRVHQGLGSASQCSQGVGAASAQQLSLGFGEQGVLQQKEDEEALPLAGPPGKLPAHLGEVSRVGSGVASATTPALVDVDVPPATSNATAMAEGADPAEPLGCEAALPLPETEQGPAVSSLALDAGPAVDAGSRHRDEDMALSPAPSPRARQEMRSGKTDTDLQEDPQVQRVPQAQEDLQVQGKSVVECAPREVDAEGPAAALELSLGSPREDFGDAASSELSLERPTAVAAEDSGPRESRGTGAGARESPSEKGSQGEGHSPPLRAAEGEGPSPPEAGQEAGTSSSSHKVSPKEGILEGEQASPVPMSLASRSRQAQEVRHSEYSAEGNRDSSVLAHEGPTEGGGTPREGAPREGPPREGGPSREGEVAPSPRRPKVNTAYALATATSPAEAALLQQRLACRIAALNAAKAAKKKKGGQAQAQNRRRTPGADSCALPLEGLIAEGREGPGPGAHSAREGSGAQSGREGVNGVFSGREGSDAGFFSRQTSRAPSTDSSFGPSRGNEAGSSQASSADRTPSGSGMPGAKDGAVSSANAAAAAAAAAKEKDPSSRGGVFSGSRLKKKSQTGPIAVPAPAPPAKGMGSRSHSLPLHPGGSTGRGLFAGAAPAAVDLTPHGRLMLAVGTPVTEPQEGQPGFGFFGRRALSTSGTPGASGAGDGLRRGLSPVAGSEYGQGVRGKKGDAMLSEVPEEEAKAPKAPKVPKKEKQKEKPPLALKSPKSSHSSKNHKAQHSKNGDGGRKKQVTQKAGAFARVASMPCCGGSTAHSDVD